MKTVSKIVWTVNLLLPTRGIDACTLDYPDVYTYSKYVFEVILWLKRLMRMHRGYNTAYREIFTKATGGHPPRPHSWQTKFLLQLQY